MRKYNILFFTCFNTRSIQLESIIYYFQKKGHNVFLLTIGEKGPIHFALEKNSIITITISYDATGRILYYYKLIRFLIKYSNHNKIDFIHSHLQIPNLISSLGRLFIKAIVFNVRHNSNVVILNGTAKEKIIDKIINRFSNNIIAISKKVEHHLINVENVNPKKIHYIQNGYDFVEYEKLSLRNEEYLAIKKTYNNAFLIVSPGRLIKTKRHDITILGVKNLISKGYPVKLLILDEGPEKLKLQNLINQNNLGEHVLLIGYVENISDYLKSADLVTILSESEASNNSIKEAGYFEKPVIACKDVGDFSDYIENDFNGILIQKEDPLNEFIIQAEQIIQNKSKSDQLGKNLKTTIMSVFDISLIGEKYDNLQDKLVTK